MCTKHMCTAAMYNLTSNTYTPFRMTELPEAGGRVLLPDGHGLVVGDVQCLHSQPNPTTCSQL